MALKYSGSFFSAGLALIEALRVGIIAAFAGNGLL
jgi:hypothetical protein